MGAGQLFLIRHGRTAGNGERYVGWEDLPLNEAGKAQARRVASMLAQTPLDALYASTLRRALETAAPLAEGRGIAVRPRDELREIHYGALQGAAKAEQRVRLRHDYRETPLPGGESLRDVHARACRVADELRPALAGGARIALVAHFWSARMLAAALLGLPFAELPGALRYKPGNGAVARLAWAPGAAQAGGIEMLLSGEEGEGE